MAQHLSITGASAYLGHHISETITYLGLPPVPCLALAYFFTTFMFSSLSAHTVAFVSTFLEVGHTLNGNPMVLTALLGYFGALGGCMVTKERRRVTLGDCILTSFFPLDQLLNR